MAAPYGTSSSHNYGRYYIGRGFGAARDAVSGKKGKGSDARNRKADFKNTAKLMKYGVDLEDYQQTRFHGVTDNEKLAALGGHAGASIASARKAATYTDENGVQGNISASYKSPAGAAVNIGGWRNASSPAAAIHGQGQQMKKIAGPHHMFLGVYKEEGDAPDKEYPLAKIPTLTSENSTTDENGHITSVGWTKRNSKTNKFESNVEDRDAYENQQNVQADQNAEWHEKQKTMYDQHGAE
jgi:hypothetical protein